MLSDQIFGSKKLISEDSQIVFVSDMFVSEYVGGAELTSQALIDSSPFKVDCLNSRDVSMETLEQGFNKFWIFGNFSQMEMNLIPTIVANMKYSILEYDYKFCRYRSPEKHYEAEMTECDCHKEPIGQMISTFFHGAVSLWFMSERQLDRYYNRFESLREKDCTVLSSVFDDNFFVKIKQLKEAADQEERKGWIVLGSNSWIKGADDAEAWCKENNLDYEVVWGLPYDTVLEKLSKAEGFVYLPKGGDTCPRMVIEAKLLGCKLKLNDHVEHAKEEWFTSEDNFDTEAYLFAARERFWNTIKYNMQWTPSISGYTTTKNCIDQGYPWEQSIKSLLGFCSEVVVVDGGSNDGTWEKLLEWSELDNKLKVHQVKRDWNFKRFAVFDGLQKAEARSRCTGNYLWQQDADEVVHEKDYDKIKELCRNFPRGAALVSLPVVEYWGSTEKVRCDINPWKWRLSINHPDITHGIPKQLRKEDSDGNLYAAPGTDGCDYIFNDTHELVPHVTFYTEPAHKAKIAAVSGDKKALEQYNSWFNSVLDQLPGVHHYSWFDIGRKIKTYSEYWQQHWESLYDIKQEDTAENNMFFDKPWSEVTAEEILSMSEKLANEMGGWIFHQKVDFSRPTPHISVNREEPEVMK